MLLLSSRHARCVSSSEQEEGGEGGGMLGKAKRVGSVFLTSTIATSVQRTRIIRQVNVFSIISRSSRMLRFVPPVASFRACFYLVYVPRFSLRRGKMFVYLICRKLVQETWMISILGWRRKGKVAMQSSEYLVRATSPFSRRGIVMHRLPHSLRSSRGLPSTIFWVTFKITSCQLTRGPF